MKIALKLLAALLAGAVALPALAHGDRDDDRGRHNQKVKRAEALLLKNGRIHTMDEQNRVVEDVLIENGRIVETGRNIDHGGGRIKVIDLRGKTVIAGIIDAHNHIVLVGNRPGWHTGMEHVFTIPDAIAEYQRRAAEVPADGIITTIGPISAIQFFENRLPTGPELDAIPRPVYIQAAQGGTRANQAAAAWFAANATGVTVDPATGVVTGNTAALLALRTKLLTPETRKRSAADALNYFNTLGITTHADAGAFHSEAPSGGIANENTYTMH